MDTKPRFKIVDRIRIQPTIPTLQKNFISNNSIHQLKAFLYVHAMKKKFKFKYRTHEKEPDSKPGLFEKDISITLRQLPFGPR